MNEAGKAIDAVSGSLGMMSGTETAIVLIVAMACITIAWWARKPRTPDTKSTDGLLELVVEAIHKQTEQTRKVHECVDELKQALDPSSFAEAFMPTVARKLNEYWPDNKSRNFEGPPSLKSVAGARASRIKRESE